MAESYYAVLGVSEDASTDEIKRAYRARLKETHPDVSDSEDASERTKRLLEAKGVLTDESERQRYDRLGHDAYTGSEGFAPAEAEADTQTSNAESGRTRSRRHSTGPNSNTHQSTDKSASTENVGSGAAWTQTGRRDRQRQSQSESAQQVWSTDRAYAVERGTDALRFGGVFRTQRALVLLGSTFLVYPVLLYGALNPTFPLAINLLVAACIVFVIAFLQSVPEVGVVVFGSWSVLLPPVLLLGFELSILSLQAVLALIAVGFPLGLSVLTRIAIRPMTAS